MNFKLCFILAAVALSGCSVSRKPLAAVTNSTSAQRANTSAEEWRGPNQGEVRGETPRYDVEGATIEGLQTLPSPHVYILIGGEPKSRVEFSDDGKQILADYWREALKYSYDERYLRAANAQEGYDRDISRFRSFDRGIRRLMETEVNAPAGRRQVYQGEATDAIAFVNRLAAETTAATSEAPTN